jgi:hypothetical protein
MSTLEELKNEWELKERMKLNRPSYNEESFNKLIRSRVRKHTNAAMKYFWASFALQLLVYALLGHVMIKYWHQPLIVFVSISGILLYVPFMIVLMKKFKAIATTRLTDATDASVQVYVQRQYDLLHGFYRFKRRYEIFLIPLVSAMGVWLVFNIWVPGGVAAHLQGVVITFGITLISCIVAINSENRKSFEEPLRQLRNVLNEFNTGG